VVTLFIVFSLPSQRDERYLLSGMPAFALLCALNWHRISREVFVISLGVMAGCLALLGYLSVRLEYAIPDARVFPAAFWLLLLMLAALIGLGLSLPRVTAQIFNVVVLLCFLSWAAFMRPLDTRLGIYSRECQDYVRGKDVWVPTNFNAREEGHRFMLPGANLHAYRSKAGLTAAALGERYPIFAISLPMDAPLPASGKVIGQRLDLGGRHTPAQIKQMIQGKVFENLFIREVLVDARPVSLDAGLPSTQASQ
jgi:hypothetical protein